MIDLWLPRNKSSKKHSIFHGHFLTLVWTIITGERRKVDRVFANHYLSQPPVSRNFQHSLSLLSSLGINRQAQENHYWENQKSIISWTRIKERVAQQGFILCPLTRNWMENYKKNQRIMKKKFIEEIFFEMKEETPASRLNRSWKKFLWKDVSHWKLRKNILIPCFIEDYLVS